MKYVVEVNFKWMVNVEASSLEDAERKVREIEGVYAALAIDADDLKTEEFASELQHVDFVNMKELAEIVNDEKGSAEE